MSFTDQKSFVLTAEILARRWSGHADGRTLRCHLCGEHVLIGQTIRWVYANSSAHLGCRSGNFFVCATCDGPNVLERAGRHEENGRKMYWYLMDADSLPAHPQAQGERRRTQTGPDGVPVPVDEDGPRRIGWMGAEPGEEP